MIIYRKVYSRVLGLFLLGILASSYANSQTLSDYARKHKEKQIEKLRVEKEAYDNACEYGTIDALREFIEYYPKSKFVQEANAKIREIELSLERGVY